MCKRAIKRGANDYLLRIVNPTWLHPPKNETTFFTRVTPVEMLSELTTEAKITLQVGFYRYNSISSTQKFDK